MKSNTGERIAQGIADGFDGQYQKPTDIWITGPEHFTKPIELADFIVGLIQQSNYVFWQGRHAGCAERGFLYR